MGATEVMGEGDVPLLLPGPPTGRTREGGIATDVGRGDCLSKGGGLEGVV